MSDKKSVILGVDDQKQNLMILDYRLRDEYDLVLKMSGREALVYLEEKPVDLILLDISMPDLSGHEVCKIIKSDDRFKEIPVIFLSAQSEPEEVSIGFDVGGNDYVVKPFNVVELKARIKSQLKAASAKCVTMKNERMKTVASMIASLNHEINNPLAILAGYLGAMKNHGVEDLNDFVVMEDSIKRISKILKEISGLSKVEFRAYGNSDDIKMLKLSGDN